MSHIFEVKQEKKKEKQAYVFFPSSPFGKGIGISGRVRFDPLHFGNQSPCPSFDSMDHRNMEKAIKLSTTEDPVMVWVRPISIVHQAQGDI
ncbi:hypothetical protein TNCT_35561 [Trichonephila clavata]|uniref:Uncharacterized protein n=1 Tax=Trichonephila clavata TaxID=2740835 RepID=A0A8X6IE71_TRICU|nr:hypothetical protein TNCT_35561 [Trichonephila clavata]